MQNLTRPIAISLAATLALCLWASESQSGACRKIDGVARRSCISSSDIASGAVKSADIRDGSIANVDLATNSVDSTKIQNGTVLAEDLAPGAVVADDILSRTLLVSPAGDGSNATANGDELLAALSFLATVSPPPGADHPWLIKLEPGVYDVGSTIVSMVPFVDVEGSGMGTTRIQGEQSGGPGVVRIADDAELRFLTVENTSVDAVMVTRAVDPLGTTSRMTHVRAMSQGPRGQGVWVGSGLELTIRDSILVGTEFSVGVGGTGNIVSTQLDGPTGGAGVFRCVGSYDDAFAALGTTCD